MSATRLFVLGALARLGPMHGHQIRREAQIDHTERWTDIKVGSLYATLHRLHDEGLIEAVRTEAVGNLPQRTIYAITSEGRRELHVLRDALLRTTRIAPDPFDLALQSSADVDEEVLRAILEERRHALAGELQAQRHHTEEADPFLNDIERLLMRHHTVRIETELAWHEELLNKLTTALDDAREHEAAKRREKQR